MFRGELLVLGTVHPELEILASLTTVSQKGHSTSSTTNFAVHPRFFLICFFVAGSKIPPKKKHLN